MPKIIAYEGHKNAEIRTEISEVRMHKSKCSQRMFRVPKQSFAE